jgi:hypothetical protein
VDHPDGGAAKEAFEFSHGYRPSGGVVIAKCNHADQLSPPVDHWAAAVAVVEAGADARIEAILMEHSRTLAEHTHFLADHTPILLSLTDAIREKIGFKAP